MDVKDQTRMLGFDDGPFTFDDTKCPLAGTMTRAGGYVEAVLIDEVTVDGTDATDTVLELLDDTGFPKTAQALAFNAGTVGGFNVVDLDRLNDELGLPVLAVTSQRPDPEAVRDALEAHVDDAEDRARVLERHTVHEVALDAGTCYVRHAGGDTETVTRLVQTQTVRGLNPEPLRIAHLVATAAREGASRGA